MNNKDFEAEAMKNKKAEDLRQKIESRIYGVQAYPDTEEKTQMDNRKTNEEPRKTILSKIDLLLAGINEASKREVDLKVAQTVQALSEAYKNLEGYEE